MLSENWTYVHTRPITEEIKAKAETDLKRYAIELYKQDPQLISLSIRNKELAEQVKAIVKEDQRQKGLGYNFDR